MDEYLRSRGEADDPLGEDGHSPVPGLVHRYPDRVLLLVTNFCSVYCRYCTRARMVGSVGERSIRKHDLEQAIDYIAGNPVVRDVLLSGGDPLSLDDERLEWILAARDSPRGIHPDWLETARGAAPAGYPGTHPSPEALSPVVDEPALHPPG
jgi:L-lysine 2,3-aminomutase